MKANKHLSITERKTIENLLNCSYSLSEISKTLSRPFSTISRDIEKHKQIVFPSSFSKNNPCLHYNSCTYRFFDCYKTCAKRKFALCEKLSSAPHVCNGCTTKQHCRQVKYYYTALVAIEEYKTILSEHRKGMHYSEEEFNVLNTDLINLIKSTKSVYHAIEVINKRGFTFKESTLYDQIKKGFLAISSKELPRNNRKLTFKEENKEYKRDITGHTYENYLCYKQNHPNAIEIQMDTVEGIKGQNQKVLFTLEIVEIKFLLAFLIDKKTQDEIIRTLNTFTQLLPQEVTNQVFEILLTDNGTEFTDFKKFISILPNCNVFYCHPYSSYEKGAIENIHEFIRRIIPKGISLNCYTQEDISLVCSHINSLFRKELNGMCPFDLVEKYIPTSILHTLGFKKINSSDVNLTPHLLGDKNIKNILKYLTKDMIKKANIQI